MRSESKVHGRERETGRKNNGARWRKWENGSLSRNRREGSFFSFGAAEGENKKAGTF